MAKPKTQCITSGCTNQRRWRGLCIACYSAAKRRIASGTETEETLVRKKMLLKACRGRPRNKLTLATMPIGGGK